jgi:hypothetical protein
MDAYREHLLRCDQCNYDLDCRVCEIDRCFDGAPPPNVPLTGHACNCPKGPGKGYLLRTNAAPPLSPELAATGACVDALEDLENLPADARLRVLACLSALEALPTEAQGRVLAFLSGRFSNYIPRVGHQHGVGVRRVIGQVVADNRPA